MAQGKFTANPKKDKKTKAIQIVLETEDPIDITRVEGNPPNVRGMDGPFNKPPDLDLNNLPADTIIFTHTNPTCAYYYFNGKWYYK
jgi:hypothetical protein